ncbi:MAG: hypothetical protein HFE78_02025 [Clostridiales bacterium]|nr:hypothetical protein [Clostridiales bacterium]
MKAFCKTGFRVCAFALVFALVFVSVQNVFRHKGAGVNYLDERYRDFREEPDGTIDVVYLGSSPMYRGVAPLMMWRETGITGVNFAVPEQSAFNNYFELQMILETQTPKLLVLDFSSLFSDRKADEVQFRYEYYRVFDALPSASLRFEMAKRIISENEEQFWSDYYFPLLRLHTRWISLTENDFDNQSVFEPYVKGAGLLTTATPLSTGPTFDPSEPFQYKEYSEYSLSYYRMIMDLCVEHGVQIAAVSFPKDDSRIYADEYQSIQRFCDENDIAYFNFNDPALLQTLGLDYEIDFYDKGHLGASGACKLSKQLAVLLKERYGLLDHRGDVRYAGWDEDWRLFYEAYADYVEAADREADAESSYFRNGEEQDGM